MKRFRRAVFAAMASMAVVSSSSAQTPEETACMSSYKPENAIHWCTKLIESKKYEGQQLAVFHMQRGWLELGRDNYQIAISDLSEALRLRPPAYPGEIYSLAYRCRARALANVDLEAALRDCAKAIPPHGRNFRAFMARGMVHLRLNRNREALDDFTKAEQKTAEAYYLRSVAHARLGDKAEAEFELAQANRVDAAVTAKLRALGFK